MKLAWLTQNLAAMALTTACLHCASSESPVIAPPPGGDASQDQSIPETGDDARGDVFLIPDVHQEGTAGDGGGDADTTGCGDGKIQVGEVCDDGNSKSGDGCSAKCDAVEQNYACPEPGHACVSTVVCGDGKITGAETCDDDNSTPGDGCSAACTLEAGWICPVAGTRCVAAKCGDGIIAGNEECDDNDSEPSDGCSATCKVELGWACDAPATPCHQTECGDGHKEGAEPCDDGNNVVGDGCNPFCEVEPNCSTGACHSSCGDGMILPGDAEQCDDGNSKDGDGCSSTCQEEEGYNCTNTSTPLPDPLLVPITFRDFIALPTAGHTQHPDFEVYLGDAATPGLVDYSLGGDGKPIYSGSCELGSLSGPCPYGAQTTSQTAFDQWYRDVNGINLTTVTRLPLARQPNGSYYYPQAGFFPWDNAGWVAAAAESPYNGHNFGFTSELRYWFEFKGGEELLFSGDDDVWVFINHQLVVDLGGLHPLVSGSITLDAAHAQALNLSPNSIYEVALFHAERHTDQSNFNLTLTGFVSSKSTCNSFCGDGIVAGDEVCDDGINDGSYGSCMPGCGARGPYCGDGQPQSPQEQCDDGTNLSTWVAQPPAGCAPGCVPGTFCGDGKVDSLFGEACDDGQNAGGYGKCAAGCQLDARCGDGITQEQFGESCDDGNTVSGDGCSSTCIKEGPK